MVTVKVELLVSETESWMAVPMAMQLVAWKDPLMVAQLVDWWVVW
jgi:hypothetical protein